MLAIKDCNLVPPGGFFLYRHAISGAEFRHHTVPHLFEQVRLHCEANGYEFTNAEFTENVCRNAHPNVCHEIDDSGVPTLMQRAASFATAVVKHVRTGRHSSDDEMYSSRRAICGKCQYFRGDTGGNYLAIACGKCGCSSLKLKWGSSTCPIGLW